MKQRLHKSISHAKIIPKKKFRTYLANNGKFNSVLIYGYVHMYLKQRVMDAIT